MSLHDSANEFYSRFGAPLGDTQVPIIYHPAVNVTLWGLEKLQPFDLKKFHNVWHALVNELKLFTADQIPSTTGVPTEQDFATIHTDAYLSHISTSSGVAQVAESLMFSLIPFSVLDRKILLPSKIACSGTIMATHYAMQRQWALNLGGGYHHCGPDRASGICFHADIPLSWKLAKMAYPQLKKAMYIDLDVHQGNGFGRIWLNDNSIYILDAYNHQIYPGDEEAKRAIKQKIEFRTGIRDEEYLGHIECGLKNAFESFYPDIIYYNAGVDILDGDRLGLCKVSIPGVVKRDEMVFDCAFQRRVPIVMIPSGGFSRNAAECLVRSVDNLVKKFKLS